MKKNIMLSLNNIGVEFGGKELFASINARVAGGELLAVAGRNGAGKSTLLKIIAGLTRPTCGQAELTVGGEKISSAARRDFLGLVSPELVLYNALSGIENVVFLAKLRGVSLPANELDEIWEITELAGRERDLAAVYSTGMRQRLKLAVILALNPPLWLLDEPSSNLDGAGKKLVADIIAKALANSSAVVLATNNHEEAEDAKTVIRLG